VGQEVDRALGRQAEEMARLSRRVQFLEGHLDSEKQQVGVLGEEVTRLEGQLGDATARMAQYESGVYGLPQVWATDMHPTFGLWTVVLCLFPACSDDHHKHGTDCTTGACLLCCVCIMLSAGTFSARHPRPATGQDSAAGSTIQGS